MMQKQYELELRGCPFCPDPDPKYEKRDGMTRVVCLSCRHHTEWYPAFDADVWMVTGANLEFLKANIRWYDWVNGTSKFREYFGGE